MESEEIKIKLVEIIKRTPTVFSFRFIPQKKINFIAGQFLQVLFDEKDKFNKELNKYLSFSSSPTKEYIEFTKRLSESRFSLKLKSMSVGKEILIRAPLGNCIFKEDYEKIGFLIGGIGITPVISMIEYVIDKGLPNDLVLLYSNRNTEEISFRKELEYWQSLNNHIKVYFFIDIPSDEDLVISGKIDRDSIKKYMLDIKERIVFSFGPPKMVEAMKNLCLELGLDMDNVKIETFIGY